MLRDLSVYKNSPTSMKIEVGKFMKRRGKENEKVI